MAIKFFVNDPFTHERIGQLVPTAYSCGFPLTSPGTLTFNIPMPQYTGPGSLVRRMVPNTVEIEVSDEDPLYGGEILWTGLLTERLPDANNSMLSFTSVDWRGWLYKRIVPPGTWANNVIIDDEHTIAYQLVDWACSPASAPTFEHVTDLSGQTRQLTVRPWWSVGKALDTIGKRDGGFEWDITGQFDDTTGRTKNVFQLHTQGAPRKNTLGIRVDNGANSKFTVGKLAEDGSRQVTRMYATSDGETPTYQSNTSPGLGSGGLVLLEDYTTYTDNNNSELLADYALAERLARDIPFATLPVSVLFENFNVSNFKSGDYAHLVMKDRWYDLDMENVRIIDMSISKSGQDAPSIVTLLLDLPSVDTEV